jgi:hypothetical protein
MSVRSEIRSEVRSALRSELRSARKGLSSPLDLRDIPQFVQSARDQHLPPASTSGNPTVDVTLTEGNTVFILAGYYRTTAPMPSMAITDTLGNTYTEIVGARTMHAIGVHLLWYVSVVEFGGATTITNTHNGSFASIAMVEFSGVYGGTTEADAEGAVLIGTATQEVTIPALSSTGGSSLVLLGAHHDSGLITEPYGKPLGFTDVFNELKNVDRPIFYRAIQSSVTNKAYTLTCNGGSFWQASGIIFSK